MTLDRRAVLGAVTAALAGGVTLNAAAIVAADPIKDAADELAQALIRKHGGKWKTHIDPETGFVLITKKLRSGEA